MRRRSHDEEAFRAEVLFELSFDRDRLKVSMMLPWRLLIRVLGYVSIIALLVRNLFSRL